MKNKIVLIIPVIVLILVYLNLKKDSFETIRQSKEVDYDLNYRPHVYTNGVVPAEKNNDLITKSFLKNLISDYTNHFNANGGANVSVYQNKYDLLFKDLLVSSDKRNKTMYPNPNEYSLKLNLMMDRIYKAELIDVYIPAATDDTVNIPANGNRLYYSYTHISCYDASGNPCCDTSCNPVTKSIVGYISILAGTYLSPDAIACELSRQFNLVLPHAGFDVKCGCSGIFVCYDKNLNRYIFGDKCKTQPGSLIIYPQNGYIINADLMVMDSIADYVMLNYTNENITIPYTSGPKYINSTSDNVLYVDVAAPGDYGEFNNMYVPSCYDPEFSNCIISGIVLTDCKLFLSLGKLNGNTCNIIPDQNGGNLGNVPPIFCQVPNNTSVSSRSVKTLLNQPSVYSSIQFYNPPISRINRFEIKWYTENGSLVRILDHCFTIRIYYFQKRLETTDFSFPIP
jgi:hypothetical protein